MKVINLNSMFDLTKVQIEFAKSIMSACSYDLPFHDDFDFNFLMDKIPVFLIDEETMEKLERENHTETHHNQNMESRPATEWLGMYMSKCNIIGVDYPVIALCPERIVRIVRDDKELCWLVAKVLIHEFSHAAMDKEDYGKRFDWFYDWVEEPMANLLTLCVVEWYSEDRRHLYRRHHYYHSCKLNRSSDLTVNGGIYHAHDFYDFVLNFVSSQPDNYRIAAYLHTERWWHESICDEWARSKDKFCNNTWQKQLWLDYWNNVLSKKCKYDDVIAYEIWKSFYDIDYDDFKKILACFQDTMKEASKGRMFSEDKIKEKIKLFDNHLYGYFRIILDRADWKKSYIAWEYYHTLCNVRIEPGFDNSGNLSSFGFVDIEKNNMSYAIDKDNDDALIRFLDKFTETAIRSAF